MLEAAHITQLLNLAAAGDADAARQIFPAVYQELRGLASARLARRPHGETIQTTALVHEAYLRIVQRHPAGWESVRHFYFAAARAMRDILVEEARRKTAAKRGGGAQHVSYDDEAWAFETPPEDVLALDAALSRLEREDPAGHQLVLLRFYAGLRLEEIAGLLAVSVRTAERKWRFLRTWLAREMGVSEPEASRRGGRPPN
jgi:RNA polymerase sigma factor (TIGR02999 family)